MKDKKTYQPTDSELEILQVLWDKGSATVRAVHEVLEKIKDTGYTTTLKTMQIMAEKELLVRDMSNRTHVYSPKITREHIQQQFLRKMINGLFEGSAGRLVMGALDREQLSSAEIREIREYLRQYEKNDRS